VQLGQNGARNANDNNLYKRDSWGSTFAGSARAVATPDVVKNMADAMRAPHMLQVKESSLAKRVNITEK